MKSLLFASLFLSTGVFAQSLTLPQLKSLLQQRQAVVERINPGMSKKVSTVSRIPTELGPCEINQTAVQTVLRIMGDKIIVHSKEFYAPAATPACAGFGTQEAAVVFYDSKPTLAAELTDLEETASQMTSISRAEEIITLIMSIPKELPNGTRKVETATVRFDLSKPLFKNTLSLQDSVHRSATEDIGDIDPKSISLKSVLFCESADSNNCQLGDWSDILY